MKNILYLLLALISIEISPIHAQELVHPNFVFILADDLGWADLGCYGNDYHETPNLDKLAKRGMRFTNAYAAAPLCSATRASILSGWAPARQHIHGVTPGGHSKKNGGFKRYPSWRSEPVHSYPPVWPLSVPKQLEQFPLERTTFAERLKERDYRTAFIGKWHLGPDLEQFPHKQGFDHTFGVLEKGYPPTYHAPYKNGFHDFKASSRDEYLTDRLSQEGAAFIENHKSSPFCLYLSHYSVHGPWQAKKEVEDHFKAKKTERTKNNNPTYAAMLKSLDDSVGRLMRKVEELGLEKNTIFIFFSDNGAILNKNGKRITSNLPLRGEKALLYEGGVRVPLIVSCPELFKTGVCDEPIISNDFFPSFLDMAGLQVDPQNPVDGVSFKPLLCGETSLNREHLTWFMPHPIKAGEGMPWSASIRQGDYKLILFFEGQRRLYNLSQDIGESHDLASQMPELANRLEGKLMSDLKAQNAYLPKKNPSFSLDLYRDYVRKHKWPASYTEHIDVEHSIEREEKTKRVIGASH